LQLQASTEDTLPFVVRSSAFRRASSIVTSGLADDEFNFDRVVFRALPVLTTACSPSRCTIDSRISAMIPSATIRMSQFAFQPVECASIDTASEVSVTPVCVVSRYLSSLRGIHQSASCFRGLEFSLKRSLKRQWLGMHIQVGALVHAVVACNVVAFRIDSFKTDVNSGLGISAPSTAVVGLCSKFNANLDPLERTNCSPKSSFSSLPSVSHAVQSVHRDTAIMLWECILQAVDPANHSGHIVALCGAHGSGKTMLCQQVASSSNLYIEIISLAAFVSPPCGSVASSWTPQIGLRSFNSVVSAVLSRRPSALVIDDFFLLDISSPAASSILNTVQNIRRVCVILCCLHSASIPSVIRSPTKFLKVVEIGALTIQQRFDVLLDCVRDVGCRLDDAVDWRDVMKYCSGFTIGDMRRLVARCLTQSNDGICEGRLFLQAVRGSSSFASSDIPVEFPSETLDSLPGFCDVHDRLSQLIVVPVVSPIQYRSMGMTLPKGVLLCGPRGSGKTSLVRAAAGSAGAALITVTPSLLYRRYLGESEAAVKSIYAAARSRSPCLVFLDDTDALLASRNSDTSDGVGERVLAALLTEIDGLEGSVDDQVFTVGATSRKNAIDPALARPGRLEQCLYLQLPCYEDRLQILTSLLSRMNVQSSVDLQSLTMLTDGMALESLVSICHRAAHCCMEKGISSAISAEDFVAAYELCKN
jgi:SpoVK/Ycf46/Vps4 family AAA+-type ATPase